MVKEVVWVVKKADGITILTHPQAMSHDADKNFKFFIKIS